MKSICAMTEAGIRVMSQDDKIASSLRIVIADHLRSLGMEVVGRQYLGTEVRLHQEFLRGQKPEINIGESYTGVAK